MTPATPRIVPTPRSIRALEGSWMFNGEVVRLEEEPDTGVLIALTGSGEFLNPMRVISRGRKLDISA